MIQVTQKQWDRLTQAERALAKTLGVAPREPTTVTKRASIPKPKPYIMRAKVYCYLCNSNTEQFLHMALIDDQFTPYLQSIKVTKEKARELRRTMPHQTKIIEMSTCPVCPEVLMKWTKEELMKKLIEVFPAARLSVVTGGKSTRENNG